MLYYIYVDKEPYKEHQVIQTFDEEATKKKIVEVIDEEFFREIIIVAKRK
jgi:chorismate mutase